MTDPQARKLTVLEWLEGGRQPSRLELLVIYLGLAVCLGPQLVGAVVAIIP